GMEITKGVRRAWAGLRQEIKAQTPRQPRGRPRQDQQSQARARKARRLKRRVAELFEHRHLFVKRRLSAAEKQRLRKLTRGQPQLWVLRQIMDEVYRLFHRRCKTQTALRRADKLRRRGRGGAGPGPAPRARCPPPPGRRADAPRG